MGQVSSGSVGNLSASEEAVTAWVDSCEDVIAAVKRGDASRIGLGCLACVDWAPGLAASSSASVFCGWIFLFHSVPILLLAFLLLGAALDVSVPLPLKRVLSTVALSKSTSLAIIAL